MVIDCLSMVMLGAESLWITEKACVSLKTFIGYIVINDSKCVQNVIGRGSHWCHLDCSWP